jgi:hypothetical protein
MFDPHIHRATSTLLASALGLAFPLAAQSIRYDTVDLGVVPGQSPIAGVTARTMSPDGVFIGGTSVWEGYVWNEVSGMRALPKPAGELSIFVEDVRNDGSAIGWSGLGAPYTRAQFWDAAGTIQPLHQPGWLYSRGVGVNASGQVLISANVPNGSSSLPRAYLGTLQGGFVDLTPAGSAFSNAVALNDAGFVLFNDISSHLLRDPSGNVTSLGLAFSPWTLEENGHVTGLAAGVAARWDPVTGWQPIPSPGLDMGRMGGMNRFGQVVASHSVSIQTSPPQVDYFLYVYTDGLGWTEIDSVVDPAQQLKVEQAAGIDDRGRIAAFGSIGPDNRAMLLTPRHVSTYGQGCSGGDGELRALAAGDFRGGGRIVLLGAGAPGSGSGVMLAALGQANVPLFGCTLRVDPLSAIALPVTADPVGRVSLPIDLPPLASGFSVYAQFVAVDASGPAGLLTMSNGVRIDVQ